MACWAASQLEDAMRTAAGRSGMDERRAIALERVAQPGDAVRSCRGGVGFHKDRIAEGDLEIVEAVADQRLERHGIDVARLDALENLVVKIDGLFVGQAEQDIAKAAVGVAAVELEMDFAKTKPAAEIGAAGPALDGVVIGLDRRGPVARPLVVQAPLHHPVGIVGQV